MSLIDDEYFTLSIKLKSKGSKTNQNNMAKNICMYIDYNKIYEALITLLNKIYIYKRKKEKTLVN